tara:strand:+ start:310 stop:1077 length:768 start_codon:yes stop_codon:yes gene_type:complete
MDELDLIESIMKKGDSYVVTTDDGSRILGKHETKKDAVKQLSAIEISMKKKIAEGAAADKIETQETNEEYNLIAEITGIAPQTQEKKPVNRIEMIQEKIGGMMEAVSSPPEEHGKRPPKGQPIVPSGSSTLKGIIDAMRASRGGGDVVLPKGPPGTRAGVLMPRVIDPKEVGEIARKSGQPEFLSQLATVRETGRKGKDIQLPLPYGDVSLKDVSSRVSREIGRRHGRGVVDEPPHHENPNRSSAHREHQDIHNS